MPRRSRWILVAVLASFMAGQLASGADERDDAFQTELTYLRGQNPTVVGRDALIKGFQDLIAKYPGDPRTADAMFWIGVELASGHPNGGPQPNRKAAAEWFRKAVAAAAPGSAMWTKSRFFLAARLPYVGDEAKNLPEARRLLEEIGERHQGDHFVLAELENSWISQCKREDDLEGVQRHVANLIHWYDDPARVPTDPNQKQIVDAYIAGAARVMAETWAVSPLPKAERAERIRKLKEENANLQGVTQTADRLLDRLEKAPVPPPPAVLAPIEPTKGRTRWTMVALNIGALALLGVFLAIRRFRK